MKLDHGVLLLEVHDGMLRLLWQLLVLLRSLVRLLLLLCYDRLSSHFGLMEQKRIGTIWGLSTALVVQMFRWFCLICRHVLHYMSCVNGPINWLHV